MAPTSRFFLTYYFKFSSDIQKGWNTKDGMVSSISCFQKCLDVIVGIRRFQRIGTLAKECSFLAVK